MPYITNQYAVAKEYPPMPARNAKPLLIENIACSGTELTLIDCRYDNNISEDDHSKDVGVQCQQCKF